MPAPIFLEPSYITLDMVRPFLSTMVRISATDEGDGAMSVGAANTLVAMAEAEVINDVLSNYLELPLQGVNGETFDELYDNPQTREYSYTPIRSMFVNCALFFIYRQYLADGGNTNAQSLFENAEDKYLADRNAYRKLDIAKNPRLKNAFRGMKRVDNFSRRIPNGSQVPAIPTGEDTAWAAQTSLLNLRY